MFGFDEFSVDHVYEQPGGKTKRYLVWSPDSRRVWVDVNELGTMRVFEEHSFTMPSMNNEELQAVKAGALEAVRRFLSHGPTVRLEDEE